MQEIRVSIIGKTGVGKSALGNALLQRDTFKSQQKTTSVTSECGSGQRILQLNGVDTLLKVVDTPGLMDIGNSNKTIAKEIVKCINLLSPGPHLFILVFRIDSRLLPEDIKVLEYFKNTFGELIDKFAVVVFTGKDQLDDRGEEDAMREHHAQLSTFSDVFKHRRFATINNKDTTEGKMRDVERILQLLQTTIQNNGGDFYKNEMYEEAKILFEARIRDEEEDKQKALSENDQLKKDQEAMAQQIKHLQQLEEERIQQWTAEREKLIKEIKKNTEIDLDRREMELKQKQKETEILRIQLLERERQSAQLFSSTSRQSYTELARTSTYQHAFRRHEKRIHDGSDDNIVDTINMSSSKKLKYELSRERGKMLQEDEKNIRDNYVFLLDNLTEPERLLDRLFSKSVFDTDDKEKIKDIKDVKGKRDMTREILDRLLNGGSNSYQSFIDSLNEEGYKTVVERLESNHGEIYHRNQLMNIEMGDRRQLMLGGINEHYHVSPSGIGDRSEIYKEYGEVDVMKVVVKKSNNTVILSKVKSGHQNVQIKEEITSGYQIKQIAHSVLNENQEPVFNHELEDEHEQDDHVKTTESNTRPASQTELEADIQTTDDSPRDITVDIIDDQKAGQDDVVSPLVRKQESEDDVVDPLVIKQEPQDETYGVPEPTLLPLISRQDIVYNDDQDEPVKTTELNTSSASQAELDADIQTTDDSPRDITVDMIDDQKSGKDDVVSPLVVKQESEDDVVSSLVIKQEPQDDVVSSLVIKQEPQDETYGVPEPTLLPLISSQDIVYIDDQDNTTLLTPGHYSPNLESSLQSTSQHQDPGSGQPSTSSCLDSSHINQRKDDTTPVKTSPVYDDDTTPVKTSPVYDDDKVVRPVDKDTLFKVCEHGTLDELKSILSDKTIDINSVNTSMYYCIISSQAVEKMRVLISTGVKLDVKDSWCDSLLHIACRDGCVETVELLLNTGRVDTESKNSNGETPIFNAIGSGKQPVEKLKLLIAAGAQLDVKDRFGNSLLHDACGYGRVETVKLLLDTGRVDIESMDKDVETPIFKAIRSRKQPIEKRGLLISSGAKLDVKNSDGNNLLHIACWYYGVETVEWLLNTGRVDIESKDSDFNTPILVAILSDKQPVQKMRVLANFGANLNVKFPNHNDGYLDRYDYSGDSLLHVLCICHKVEDVEFLLSKNVDIEIRNKENETPIISALSSSTQSIQKVELLLAKGAKLDHSSSILHYACHYGSLDSVKYFINKGFNVEARNDKNESPLVLAICSTLQSLHKVKVLLNAGANPDNSPNIHHYACQYGSLENVRYFIKKKLFNIESRDDNNRTPLFSCVLTKRIKFKDKIDLLMSMNVNKMVRDINNLSVLQFARQHARKTRVQYLIKNGFTD